MNKIVIILLAFVLFSCSRQTESRQEPAANTAVAEQTIGIFEVAKGNFGDVTFKYQTKASGVLKVKIFSLNGDAVKTISVDATAEQKGEIRYDCRNETGGKIPPGIYLVVAEGAGMKIVKKMVVGK